jgi:hypothetical protein
VNILHVALACSTGILLVGCASTTIYPEGKGNFSLVTTSAEQGYAEKDAEKKAAEYCTGLGKSLVVISHKTEYHGPDKNNAAVIGLASAILTRGPNPAQSNQDYEVTMKFTCN